MQSDSAVGLAQVGGPDNVRHAAFDFHACRVGHGYAVASGEEDELLASLVSHGLHFEASCNVCFKRWDGRSMSRS